MKEQIRAIKKLRSKGGETLVESLVSLLIITLISLASAMSVQTALKITDNSLESARESQHEINTAVGGVLGIPGTLTFTGSGISASHSVTISDSEWLIAFEPRD